jgi:hypothetical protein
VFSDPLSVTYSGSNKQLPRISVAGNVSRYRTADGEFEVVITKNFPKEEPWRTVQIRLLRHVPDPTPTDVFDNYRDIVNGVSLGYSFDVTNDEVSDNLPKLRTALLSLVDSTFEGRLRGGEL